MTKGYLDPELIKKYGSGGPLYRKGDYRFGLLDAYFGKTKEKADTNNDQVDHCESTSSLKPLNNNSSRLNDLFLSDKSVASNLQPPQTEIASSLHRLDSHSLLPRGQKASTDGVISTDSEIKTIDEIAFARRAKMVNLLESGLRKKSYLLKVGNEEVKVYTIFLAAQSDSFYAWALENDDKPEVTKIEIYGAGFETVKKFVEFIHCGKIEKLEDCVEELFVLANKYGIGDLKEMCCAIWDASKGKIIDRLAFAFQQDIEEFKEKAIRRATDTIAFNDLIVLDEWAELIKKDKALARKICAAFGNRP